MTFKNGPHPKKKKKILEKSRSSTEGKECWGELSLLHLNREMEIKRGTESREYLREENTWYWKLSAKALRQVHTCTVRE